MCGKIVGGEMLGKSKIDFVLKKDDKLVLMELRMSEHTGGRTGQESLMDKFNKFLELLASEKDLAAAIRESHIENVDLVIETVFSEDNESIVDQPNAGRLNSLINYLCEENHVYGKIKKLTRVPRDEFCEELKTKRVFSFDYDEIHFSLRLTYGNEFFRMYVNKELDELLDGLMVPDDVWLLFTVAMNELRRSKLSSSGKTLTCEVYEILRGLSGEGAVLEEYEREIQNIEDPGLFVDKLDEITNDIRDRVLRTLESSGRRFVILDTDDVTKSYSYLNV